MDETTTWPGEWLRGVLGACVLRVLCEGPSYGYAITRRLADAGLGEIKGGTLYPLLSRLEDAGFVGVDWRAGDGGPGRKYFSLTPAGRQEATRLAQDWARFTTVTRALTDDAHPRKALS